MKQLRAMFSRSTDTTKQKTTTSPTVSATIVENKQASSNRSDLYSVATGNEPELPKFRAVSQSTMFVAGAEETQKQRLDRLGKAGSDYYIKEEVRQAAARQKEEEKERQAAARQIALERMMGSPIKPGINTKTLLGNQANAEEQSNNNEPKTSPREKTPRQEDLLVASETQVEPKVAPNAETPPPFELVPTTILKSEEERAKELEAEKERARLAKEAEAEKERARLAKEAEAERVKKEAEERALAEAAEADRVKKEEEKAKELAEATERASILEAEEKAKQTIPLYTGDTPKDDENEDEDEKRKREINNLFSAILDNIDDIDENLRQEVITELWDDFISNQDYIPVDTNNATGSIHQNSNPPMRDPLPLKKYTAKLAPKTYYGVGIQTKLVQEENQNSFLQINQFYDDSGFKSELESKDPPIKTTDKNIRITEIYCKFGDEEKFYSIDEIFKNCYSDEETFNLKLCDIFRHPEKKELKLKFSTLEGSGEDQELTIQKSVFRKDENNKDENNDAYKNIKTVIKQQTVTKNQNQTIPSEAPSAPENMGRPVENVHSLVG